jgi:putative transposase
MSRPLRIEYEGAWYHVMNRGTDRKLIFAKDEFLQNLVVLKDI